MTPAERAARCEALRAAVEAIAAILPQRQTDGNWREGVADAHAAVMSLWVAETSKLREDQGSRTVEDAAQAEAWRARDAGEDDPGDEGP